MTDGAFRGVSRRPVGRGGHGNAVTGIDPDVAVSVRVSAAPGETHAHPPVLGEHADDVLPGILGMNDAEAANLRTAQLA